MQNGTYINNSSYTVLKSWSFSLDPNKNQTHQINIEEEIDFEIGTIVMLKFTKNEGAIGIVNLTNLCGHSDFVLENNYLKKLDAKFSRCFSFKVNTEQYFKQIKFSPISAFYSLAGNYTISAGLNNGKSFAPSISVYVTDGK